MSTLDNILGITRSQIDDLRAESADHAREATRLAEQMAEPTDAYRAMESEHRDLLLKAAALEDEMRTAKSALDAMAAERDLHLGKADAAADVADHFETRTLPGLAEILDGADIPPREALAATGLMPREDEPKPPADAPTCAICGEPLAPDGGGWLHWHGPRDHPATPEDLPFNVVQAPADVIAAITGGTRVITDEPPRTDTVHTSGTGAGVIVATGGPTVTMPDTGLNPPPLPPASPTAEARHAKDRPGLLARLTGGHRTIPDDQDGDDA